MEPQPIGAVLERVIPGEESPRQQPRKPSESMPNTEQQRRASPMVIPTVMPETIIAQVLRVSVWEIYEEPIYLSYIRHVKGCRKISGNWDEYRNRIEPEILEKWGKILDRLRRQGFLFGFIKSVDGVDRIIWAQRVHYHLAAAAGGSAENNA
jgi:hypothetical protein